MSNEYREAVKMLRQACDDDLIEATAPAVQGQMVERVVQFARKRAAEELRAAAECMTDWSDAAHLHFCAEALAHHEEAK